MTGKRDYIQKAKGGFEVRSHSGKLLGKHKTRGEALQQLRAVEYHKAKDSQASMGKLELPGAIEAEEWLGRDIGTSAPLDAFGAVQTNTPDPLQPHELPVRRGNPHHAPDPMREHPPGQQDPDPHEISKRYLQVEEPKGGPAVDASGAPGGNEASDPTWPEYENLATERAERRAGEMDNGAAPMPPFPEDDAPLDAMAREEYRAPFEPGGNGDPAPNPSKQQTIGATKAVSIAGHPNELGGPANAVQPDEYPRPDEGDPNQYEMLSTARKAPDLNEATEPGYGEVSETGPQASQSAGWKDPSGDDDWLKTIGALPNMEGSRL